MNTDQQINIYLDIDGVLLANDLNPANHANDFIRLVLSKYPNTTYWLTTHCNGDSSVPVQHVGHLFEPDVQELLRRIKPTSWETAKTRAIDFSKQSLWFDDSLFYEEKQELLKHGVLDNWIEVDLARDENQLAQFLSSFPIPTQINSTQGVRSA